MTGDTDGNSDGDADATAAFELRDHTADVAVAATGDTVEDVFAAFADGLAAASCDDVPDEGGERFDLAVTAESLEALLFEYLDELIYLRDVRLELPVDNRVSITNTRCETDADEGSAQQRDDAWHLEGSARGLPVAAIDAREIKAVTYSEMRLEELDERWDGYVVFDV